MNEWNENGNPKGNESEGEGMTEPLRWPYSAANARDTAATLISDALMVIQPIATGAVRDESGVRLLKACLSLSQALRWLESVGGCTRPSN